ncbi:hypothetical protein [Dokdonia sp.]|uniref:toxin-antitoxin system YwqK family antitoxin n=1 Tax=Dokdonia sp. TaxID=2024995 RepID=UPI00326562F2
MFLSFGKESIQRKIIRDGAYDYVIYVSVGKSIKINNLKTYFWYRSGEIKNTIGGIGGDVLHEEFNKYYSNKQLAEQGNFYYGLKDGIWKSWYDNGNVEKVISYHKGVAQGNYYAYDTSGIIKAKGHYSKGKKSGTWITYDAVSDTIKYKKGEVFIKKEKDTLKPSLFKKVSLWIQQKTSKKKDSLKDTKANQKKEKKKRRKREKTATPNNK